MQTEASRGQINVSETSYEVDETTENTGNIAGKPQG